VSEFNPRFKVKGKISTEDRYNSIKEALENGIILPAVELYKIKDEYYVADGHHRIAIGREMAQEYIDACISEFLPAKDSPENALYLRRFDFEQKLGIEGIFLSQPSGYDELAWQIDLHQQYLVKKRGREFFIEDAAHDWFYSIHRPVVQKIEAENQPSNSKVLPLKIYIFICQRTCNFITKGTVTT
jgi:hypothetical protein